MNKHFRTEAPPKRKEKGKCPQPLKNISISTELF